MSFTNLWIALLSAKEDGYFAGIFAVFGLEIQVFFPSLSMAIEKKTSNISNLTCTKLDDW